jgi:GxxExxY protein
MRDDLTEAIIGAAMEVHKILGPGLLESIHEEALSNELTLREIPRQRQVALDVRYKDRVILGQRLDLLVETGCGGGQGAAFGSGGGYSASIVIP